MGSLISAKCKCGYERRMALGGGMRNHLTYCAFPCYCQDCNSLYVADLFSDDTSCEECGSQNTVPYDDNSMRFIVVPRTLKKVVRYMQQSFWDKLLKREPEEIVSYVSTDINVFDWHTHSRLGRDLFLTGEDYLCPKCQKFSLRFFSVGCWD